MTSRIMIEPDYTCAYCGTPMTKDDIRNSEGHNYFCSVGCYYGWNIEMGPDESEDEYA